MKVVIMKKIKYLIYDKIRNLNTKTLKLKKFYYTENTLCYEFREQLLKSYPILLHDCIDFMIINGRDNPIISLKTCDMFFGEIARQFLPKEKIIVIPLIPNGGTFAIYKNIKLIIHSKEDIHKNLPHIHVIGDTGISTRLDLNTLTFIDKDFLSKKERKKILEYVRKNKDFLIESYNKIVQHQELDKIVIDIIK